MEEEKKNLRGEKMKRAARDLRWMIVPPLFLLSVGLIFVVIIYLVSNFGFLGLLGILAVLSFIYWRLI